MPHKLQYVETDQPKVSILIPFFNCAYVAEAIESALSQTYANREVIVIDDGSTRHAEKLEPFKQRVRVVRKTNGGTASALNVGLKVADGDYVAWLSSDDIFRPQKIARQVEFLRQQRALACYSAFSHIDSSGAVVQQGYRPTPLPTWRYLRRMTVVNPVNGCTVLIRREVFEQVGPFDESLRYTHDYEMWMRIIWKFDMHYLDEDLVMYRLHEQMGSRRYYPELMQEWSMLKRRWRRRVTLEALKRSLTGRWGRDLATCA